MQGSQLLDDLLVADDSNGTELSIFDPRSSAWQQYMETMHGNAAASRMLEKAAAEEAAAAAALNVRRVSAMDDLRCVDEQLDGTGAGGSRTSDSPSTNRSSSPDVSLGKDHIPGTTPYTPDVKLWHRAVVVHQENSLRGLVRQLSIDQLDNEGRRVSIYENGGGPGGAKEKSPLFTRSMSVTVRLFSHGRPSKWDTGLAAALGWRLRGFCVRRGRVGDQRVSSLGGRKMPLHQHVPSLHRHPGCLWCRTTESRQALGGAGWSACMTRPCERREWREASNEESPNAAKRRHQAWR